MLRHSKSYFTLEEESRWEASGADMQYYMLKGLFEVSTWVFGLEVRKVDGSDPHTLNGLHALHTEDLFGILRIGASPVARFCQNGLDVRRVDRDPPFVVREDDLLITRAERDRFERACGFVAVDEAHAEAAPFNPLDTFRHDATYAHIEIGSEMFDLGPMQANVIKQLHEVAGSDQPWLRQTMVLQNAGSRSTRLVDLFGDKAKLGALIERDSQGNCRLNLPLRPVTSLRRSAYGNARRAS